MTDNKLDKAIPELAHYPTREAKMSILRAWNREMIRRWQTYLVPLAVGIVASLIVNPSLLFLQRFGVPAKIRTYIGGAIVGLSVVFFLTRFYKSAKLRFIRDDLNRHGIPICRSCGYDLNGLSESRCPECGAIHVKTNVGRL